MDTRPVHLNLFKIYFPNTAIASILHRVSGVIIFLLIPMFLWMLQATLSSPQEFESMRECLTSPWGKLFIWGGLSALAYHLIAGIRHLIMDCGVGESKEAGRRTAWLVMIISFLAIVTLGYYIW